MLQEVNRLDFMDCIPDRERNLSDKAFKVFYEDQGNFSVVVIQTKTGSLYAGISKRNPADKPSEAGMCIAAVRAWRSYQGKSQGYGRQRPVTRKQARKASVSACLKEIFSGFED